MVWPAEVGHTQIKLLLFLTCKSALSGFYAINLTSIEVFGLFEELLIFPLKHWYYYKVLNNIFSNSGYLFNRFSIHYNLRTNLQNLFEIPHYNL